LKEKGPRKGGERHEKGEAWKKPSEGRKQFHDQLQLKYL